VQLHATQFKPRLAHRSVGELLQLGDQRMGHGGGRGASSTYGLVVPRSIRGASAK
jgi:hypothetical protein